MTGEESVGLAIRCIGAAVSVSPAGTQVSALAWKAYANLLYDTPDGHKVSRDAAASLQQPKAQQADAAATRTAVPEEADIEAAQSTSAKVQALQAYCMSLQQAGQTMTSPNDHITVLLRVLKVKDSQNAAYCRCSQVMQHYQQSP
jgi:hypothetical protein